MCVLRVGYASLVCSELSAALIEHFINMRKMSPVSKDKSIQYII